MIYATTLTTASIRVRESRTVAALLLNGVSDDAWQTAILDQNVLQTGSPLTAKKVSGLIRARLEPLGKPLWEIVRDGTHEQATQAVFAGAVKHSRLLGDFMDITIRDQRALFADRLERRMWTDYIAGCRGRDPEMPQWRDSTVDRLRSAVFSMLADAGYLKDTRSLLLQNLYVDGPLADYLRDRGEAYVLRCMEVME